MSHPLDGVRAKIERAKEHIEQLDLNILRFERKAYTLRAEPDINSGLLNYFVVDMGLGDPPVPLRLLAGEIAYQLRSALDHIIYILAKDARENKREFPIFEELDKYESDAPSKIKGVSPRAETIIKDAQPFHASSPHEHPLWMLHKINNTDKHRVIPACSVYTSQVTTDFSGGPVYFINLEVGRREAKDGTKIGPVPLPRDYTSEMKMDSQVLFTVAFNEIGDSKLEPAVPLLLQIVGRIEELVSEFMGEF
jgi:hypothetical protein